MVDWTDDFKKLVGGRGKKQGKSVVFMLKDVDAPKGDLKVLVRESAGVLTIDAAGHGNCTGPQGDSPIVGLQLSKGRLQILVFGDINSEEPTHTISLEGALESKRAP